MVASMFTCLACQRHVMREESVCPFCDSAIAVVTAPTPTKLSQTALVVGLALFGCTGGGGDETSNSQTVSASASDTDTTLGTADTDADATLAGDGDPYGCPPPCEEEGGDGDGDLTTGDGDGDGDGDVIETPCQDLDPTPLPMGTTDVMNTGLTSSFDGTCGGPGPDVLYRFDAVANGLYNFAITSSDFEASLYLVESICDPLQELSCVNAPDTASVMLQEGEPVYVIVDSQANPGVATLEVTQ